MGEFFKAIIVAAIGGLIVLFVEYFYLQRKEPAPPAVQGASAAGAEAAQFPLPGTYLGKLVIRAPQFEIPSGDYRLQIDENLACTLDDMNYNRKYRIGTLSNSKSDYVVLPLLGNAILSKLDSRLEIRSDESKNPSCNFSFTRYE